MLNGKRIVHGLWIPLFLAILGSAVWAQDQNPRVVILPFTVRGQQEPVKIQKTIEELLIRQLTNEGARVISPQDVEKVVKPGEAVQTEEQARVLGRRLQAEYALIGSFNQIGNSISLDARLVNISGEKKTEIIFAEEKGLENLAAAANAVVQRMLVNLLAKAVIAEVQIRGNERIEPDAIKLHIRSKKSEVLRPEQVAEDIRPSTRWASSRV
jgi:outer membrane protein insertion porin family